MQTVPSLVVLHVERGAQLQQLVDRRHVAERVAHDHHEGRPSVLRVMRTHRNYLGDRVHARPTAELDELVIGSDLAIVPTLDDLLLETGERFLLVHLAQRPTIRKK